MAGKILLVDDETDFLDVFGEFLTDEGYAVTTAENGDEALRSLQGEHFDLLLSDIHMPGMKGFELLNIAGQRFPSVKKALITAYDIRDYLNLAKNYDIGNIITKTTPFNFDEVRILVNNIISGDVFGLEKYVKGNVNDIVVKSTNDIEHVIEKIVGAIEGQTGKRKFRQALGEIIINAFFYGGKNEIGSQKDTWNLDAELDDEMAVKVSWGFDHEKIGVAVRDQRGRLSKKEFLFWLERNSTRGADGLSVGLTDDHGKGLFIAHETIDRLIINVKPGKITEVVMLNYINDIYSGHQPLWIHEV